MDGLQGFLEFPGNQGNFSAPVKGKSSSTSKSQVAPQLVAEGLGLVRLEPRDLAKDSEQGPRRLNLDHTDTVAGQSNRSIADPGGEEVVVEEKLGGHSFDGQVEIVGILQLQIQTILLGEKGGIHDPNIRKDDIRRF